MAEKSMKELSTLASFIVDTDFHDLPSPVIERAKWVIRDTVAVIVAGMREPEVRALADYSCKRSPGDASLFGHGGKTSPAWAALVHGTAGTSLEMDEGHAFARGHAAIHAVPPALALAQAGGKSGESVIADFVVGYEVAARAGIGTRLRKGVHPFGAWGVLGAAAIGARHHGLGPAETAGVLEVAASYAIAPSFKTAYQGANVRNTYAGMVNHLGLLAADFYGLGFRGENGGLATTFGEILGDSFDASALVDGLGERYEIERGYFKPYSACRYAHGAVDGVFGLAEEGEIELDEVERVEVATYDIAASLSDPVPLTPLAGRFSMPYVVAATMTFGSAGPEIFQPEALTNPQVLDLAGRVAVVEDPDFTARTPAQRPARVTVYFKDGSQREHTVMGSKGDPDQPMSDEELETKFLRLAAPSVGEEQATTAWRQLGRLQEVDDLSVFTEVLANPPDGS